MIRVRGIYGLVLLLLLSCTNEAEQLREEAMNAERTATEALEMALEQRAKAMASLRRLEGQMDTVLAENQALKKHLEGLGVTLGKEVKGFELKVPKLQGVHLLMLGSFHGDEVPDDYANKRWLGVYDSASQYAVREADIVVSKEHDPIMDEEEAIKTGKGVAMKDAGASKPLFLVAGLPRAAGTQGQTSIQCTGFSTAQMPMSLYPGQKLYVRLGENDYTLSTTGKAGAYGLEDYMLAWSFRPQGRAGSDVSVAYASNFDDAMMSIYWVGDVDGDGLCDLLMDVSRHYNGVHLRLYLSDPEKRQPFRGYVSFQAVGC